MLVRTCHKQVKKASEGEGVEHPHCQKTRSRKGAKMCVIYHFYVSKSRRVKNSPICYTFYFLTALVFFFVFIFYLFFFFKGSATLSLPFGKGYKKSCTNTHPCNKNYFIFFLTRLHYDDTMIIK